VANSQPTSSLSSCKWSCTRVDIALQAQTQLMGRNRCQAMDQTRSVHVTVTPPLRFATRFAKAINFVDHRSRATIKHTFFNDGPTSRWQLTFRLPFAFCTTRTSCQKGGESVTDCGYLIASSHADCMFDLAEYHASLSQSAYRYYSTSSRAER